MMGVESEVDPCCELVVAPFVAEMMPKEEAGVGAGEAAAGDGAGAATGAGGRSCRRRSYGLYRRRLL